MSEHPENGQPQPQAPRPEASGAPRNEETKESLIERFKEKLKELKEKAKKVLGKRSEEKKSKPSEAPQKKDEITVIAQKPEQYKLQDVIKKDDPAPEDPEVQLILQDIIIKAKREDGYLDKPQNLSQMQDWIMELQIVIDNRASKESAAEAEKYKFRLLRKYVEVAIEKQLNEKKLSGQNRKDERLELVNIANTWLKYGESDIPPEAIAEQVSTKTRQKIKILSLKNTPKQPTTETESILEEIQRVRKDDSAKTIPKEEQDNGFVSGRAHPPGGAPPGLQFIDPASPEYRSYSDPIKRIIDNVNTTTASAARFVTDHYIEGIMEQVDRVSVSDNEKARIKQELNRLSIDAQEIRNAAESRDREERYRQQHIEQLLSSERYSALGYNKDDLVFLKLILSDPREVEEFLSGNEKYRSINIYRTLEQVLDADTQDEKKRKWANNYKIFSYHVKNIFDHLFDGPAGERHHEFEHSWSQIIHGVVHEEITAAIDQLVYYFESNGHNPITVKTLVKTEHAHDRADINKVREEDVGIAEALDILKFRMAQEESLRKYNHNIGVVMRRRLPIEKFAEFAQQLDASNIDVLFLEDEMVQTAYRFYIQELKKTSADNFWVIGTTWLGEDPQGQILVESQVKERLKQYALMKGRELSYRDLNRFISIASGTAFGITGEGFDILAQNQPPLQGGERENSGYLADNILPFWNMQHQWRRFDIPSMAKELLYVRVRGKGTKGPWSHQQLIEDYQSNKNKLKTGLTWSLSGGPPVIDAMSRLFGIRGFLSRGGWRTLAATSHHLVDADGKNVVTGPYTWDFGEGDAKISDEAKEKLIADAIDWKRVDWDKSFENLERAGSGILLSYWIDKRAGVSGENKEALYKKYLWKLSGRNPLIFLRYDLAESHRTSLRYKVLGRLDRFRNRRNDYEQIQEEVDQIERDMMMVTDLITSEKRWNANDHDWEQIGNLYTQERQEAAKAYWEALRSEIGTERPDGTVDYKDPINTTHDKFLKEKYYFFGSEDIDFREMATREAGFDVLKRVFGDAHLLSQAVTEFSSLPTKLKEAGMANDYKELIKSINTICTAVDQVHGLGDARKMGYYLTTMVSRYYGKAYWARFPLGIGTVLGWFMESSLSGRVGGGRVMEWDEQMQRGFMNDVRMTGYLADKGEFSMETLGPEIGARRWQVAYDILRSAVPLILFLLIFQALNTASKEE